MRLLSWLLAWNQNKHITYCMHISYTGLEITIDLPYNSIGLLPENKQNQMLLIKQTVKIRYSAY